MQHKIIEQKLSNGISLVMVPLQGTAAVTCIVFMGVGSRYESDSQRGLAHFTEHMVFKGGRTFKTAQSIAQALDAVGGEFNAFTSQEYTGFYTKTSSEHLELGLNVLSDMVLHAHFPEEELVKEKGVIVEEINMYEDIPMRKVDNVLSSLAFGTTPLGLPVIGTKESVTAFTRDDFVNYRKEFYKGAKCTIVLAGAIDHEESARMVEQYFRDMPAGEAYEPEAAVMQTERVRIEYKASEQTHLMLGVEGYALGHPKRFAYRLLSTILGGNMSSRLFVSVREEQGLCYYVRMSPDIYKDAGLLVASAGVDNNRLPQAVEAIIKEMQKVHDTQITEEELDRAKQFLLGRTLLGMEDSEQVAEFYGMQQVIEGKIETLESMEEAIRNVTAEEVFEVAKELFVTEGLRLAVIGPQKNEAELLQLLHFN
jgi:predicted Zn-dependent peptidase